MKGSIILVQNNEGHFLSNAIKFFTKRAAKKYGVENWTHSMFYVGKFFNEDFVFSAEAAQSIMPLKKFQKPKVKYVIYKINDNIKAEDLDNLIKDFFLNYAGDTYGFFQLFWFIYRWIAEIIGLDVRKKNNWFPTGDICSEMTFRFLTKRLEYSNKNVIIKNVLNKLNEWTENTIHPVDLAYIIKKFPLVFEKVEEWN
jgi:hypothetical protein